ncbi:MAG: hypothetical protein HC804_05950 [Anaerolineae bacterium]|nr:hypothetical protein [Anaerolineae bacterium]
MPVRLAEWGQPRYLPRCGGWILQRSLPNLPYQDAMGCYPLFTCTSWSGLADDLAEVGDELVSLAVVTDPFGAADETVLRQAFPDLLIPFKQHYVVDLQQPWPTFVRGRHQRYARRVLQTVQVELCPQPLAYVTEWTMMYQHLVERHDLRGLHAFSAVAFAQQLAVPGAILFRAQVQDELVGMYLWYVQKEVAYAHLIACTPLGYELRAMYALYWVAFSHFYGRTDGRVQWLNIGGSAGVGGDQNDGLSQFKRGWATGVRQAYFGGRIFNQSQYEELVSVRGNPVTSYFPAYRQGEFGHENKKAD